MIRMNIDKKALETGEGPGHDHNVYGPDRAHLVTKITEYFKANL